jgi:hypothetical protein
MIADLPAIGLLSPATSLFVSASSSSCQPSCQRSNLQPPAFLTVLLCPAPSLPVTTPPSSFLPSCLYSSLQLPSFLSVLISPGTNLLVRIRPPATSLPKKACHYFCISNLPSVITSTSSHQPPCHCSYHQLPSFLSVLLPPAIPAFHELPAFLSVLLLLLATILPIIARPSSHQPFCQYSPSSYQHSHQYPPSSSNLAAGNHPSS